MKMSEEMNSTAHDIVNNLWFCRSGSSWLRVVPWGLRKLLVWIKDNYGNPPIYITENGISDRNATLQDTHRVNYYRDYINQAFKGMFRPL